jgi:hypothetical protein
MPLTPNSLILYSTNPWMKFHVQETFRKGKHYVWCSEFSDSRAAARGSLASLVPPSSNPVEIYMDLASAITRNDRHHSKIEGIKATYLSLSTDWVTDGSMTSVERDELVYLLEHAEMKYWRPMLYLIPRSMIDASRLKLVHPSKRAGLGPEYIIEDLDSTEFETLELS